MTTFEHPLTNANATSLSRTPSISRVSSFIPLYLHLVTLNLHQPAPLLVGKIN